MDASDSEEPPPLRNGSQGHAVNKACRGFLGQALFSFRLFDSFQFQTVLKSYICFFFFLLERRRVRQCGG